MSEKAYTKSLTAEAVEINEQKRRDLLINILNDANGVLDGIAEAHELRSKLLSAVQAAKRAEHRLELSGPTDDPNHDGNLTAVFEDLKHLQERLTRVRLVPLIGISTDLRSLSYREDLYFDQRRDSCLLEVAQKAYLALGHLIRDHRLVDLRRCECGSWFIAGRADQRFCSASCRQRSHFTAPDFNKKRRERYRAKKQQDAARRVSAKRAKAGK